MRYYLLLFCVGILGLIESKATRNQNDRDGSAFECGLPVVKDSMQLFIVGGHEATPGAWPWQVSLRHINEDDGKMGSHFCGGSLIGREWVLTASHCAENALDGSVGVVAGISTLTTDDTNSYVQKSAVAEAILHPDYDTETVANDIAVLRLKTPLKYDDKVQPVCLADQQYEQGTTCTVTGWGAQQEQLKRTSTTLQQVSLPIVDLQRCRDSYPSDTVTENHICAGYDIGGRDACQGDSGGPLVTKETTGMWYQVGVVSWGYGCARPNQPGVYTNVYKYRSWIQEVTKSDSTNTE
ncbi:chymotrypsinogen B-like [Amphiura filiformis]|uniref:chymotrypsinogen B-like n=1 Tax=Amphiura filiformis TaxID=82378 RepID=UPI003B21FCB2